MPGVHPSVPLPLKSNFYLLWEEEFVQQDMDVLEQPTVIAPMEPQLDDKNIFMQRRCCYHEFNPHFGHTYIRHNCYI